MDTNRKAKEGKKENGGRRKIAQEGKEGKKKTISNKTKQNKNLKRTNPQKPPDKQGQNAKENPERNNKRKMGK